MCMKSLISIRNYKKVYPNTEITFQHIDINNCVTIIQGDNGSGKSTLLKSIAGLIKYQGEIIINGTTSYMPEHHSFPKDTTLKAFLDSMNLLYLQDHSYYDLLKTFKLDHKLDDLISTLSKGMLGKLNLIQCLLKKCDIYILDEPFSGLDKESTEILIKWINNSSEAFIISTHINRIYENLAVEVIHL